MNIVFMSMDTLPSTLWARDLYDEMHIRSDFRKWFPRMCQYGFIEGRDYEYMPRVRLQDEGGRTVQRYVKDYRITQDMAKKLCKLHHTAVGAAYHPQPFDWDALLGLLHKKPPRRSSYEAQLSDSDSLVTTTQIAKEYGCGAKVFNRLLHLHGIQYRANGQWVLYSEHHGKGYTSSLTFRLQRSDGSEVEKLHTAWTQKGRKFLYHTLKRRGVLPLAEQGGYTGDLAQGRSRVKSYKVHQIEAVPREEWVEVAGTHEAIIDYETFDKVQALLQRDTRTSPKGREVHLFSGFLKCADCGRAITRCVGKNNNVYYSCSTYKNRSRTACTMHSIKHERLEAAVLFAVQHQVHLAVSYSEIVTQINSAPIKKSQSYRLDDLIAAKERELTKITRYKQSLYQDWKDGEITQQEYRDMKADYERQTSDISAVLTRLNAERAELANGVDNEHPALVAFMKYQNIEALNREILVELVDYIKVYENGNISGKFKFADELRKIAEYIEINTTEDTAVAG